MLYPCENAGHDWFSFACDRFHLREIPSVPELARADVQYLEAKQASIHWTEVCHSCTLPQFTESTAYQQAPSQAPYRYDVPQIVQLRR